MARRKAQVQPEEKPAYFLEWEASKVAPEIIDKNVTFLEGNNAYEALLYSLGQEARTNSGQLRQKYLLRYNHLFSGGWFCSTLDPLANFSRTDWGCFKPLEPKEKDGKKIKYEHPPNANTRAFFLEIGEAQYQKISELWEVGKTPGQFWEWLQANPTVPLIITEGAKKAGALLTAGYPAIALPGVNSGYRTLDGEKYLIPEITQMGQPGREIILCFDQDSKFKTQKMVNRAILETGKLLLEQTGRVSVMDWDPAQGKGIDDWIVAHGEKELHQLVEDRISLAEFGEKKIRKVRKFTQNAHFLDFLRETELDKKLKYNLLSLEIELDGNQFDDPDWFYMWFCDRYSVEVSEKIFFGGVNYFAQANKYHPVRDYLESVADLPPADLDNAAARYFGLTDPISNILLKRWLIGAVARVHKPGCKLQGALILYGKGGRGKSTFFEKLGGPFYGGDVDDIRGKDNLLKQHNYWIIECQEFDQITSRSQAAALKGWITTDTDQIRPPYGRKASPHRRGFAIGGSVNGIEFLSDPTGSRRFWILDVGNRFVDNDLLESERDNLWAAVVQAYIAGERWHLTAEEENKISDSNKRYEVSDEWAGIVEEFISGRNAVTAMEILTEALDFEEKAITRKESLRITNILTSLEWGKIGQRREIYEGRSRRGNWWVRPEIMEAMESGKLSPQASITEIKGLDLSSLNQGGVLTPPSYSPPPSTSPESSIRRLEPSDSNKNEQVSYTTPKIEQKKEKEKTSPGENGSHANGRTNKTPLGILDDSHRESQIEEINSYKEMLGWTTEDLRKKAKELVGKESIFDCSPADLMNLIYWLRRQIP
jgi:predicted P-loop ATPase